MWASFHLVLVLCAVFVKSEEREERVVKTPQGPVRGYKEPENELFAFYGIPYATAPTGPHKFSAPYPPPAWLQPFEAIDNGVVCPQAKTGFVKHENIQENCLIANVYVPDTDEKKLPVVVYVHGGAFQIGFSNLIVPKNLVKKKKVIAITFNYRLGVHGFLCLGTKDIPGNAGLKDQVALLKWVKKNIASYGGNPDDVTIAGYSAGSTSVDILMLSPAARGLFNKVIPESGANIGAFAVQMDPLDSAKSYAKSVGFDNVDDFYALEQFYKTVSYEVLTTDTFMNRTDNVFVFSPCIERNTEADAILTDSPYNILKEGKYKKVPILYGFANMEGLFRAALFDEWKDKMNENLSEFLPVDLTFASDEEKQEVTRQVKEFYFDGKPVSKENILSYIDYFTDTMFAFSTLRATKLHAEAGHDKVFLYEYSFVDETTPVIPYTNNVKGASHCAQTMAVMDGANFFDFSETNLPEEYLKMKNLLRDVWINFIVTGNPVPPGSSLPEWPSANAAGSPHMSFGTTVELRGALLEERMRFWHDIYEKYYRMPVPPLPPPHTEL